MKTRNIKLFNKTIPLIPLIAALVVGSVVIGYATTNGFLTIIPRPFQQTTYHQEDTITIGVIPEFIEAFVTLEGDVNEQGEFVLGLPISVDLVINSLRPYSKVSDNYILMISEVSVLDGFMVNVEPGLPHTHSGTWTPLVEGPVDVVLDITDMLWTMYVTFTSVSFVEPEGNLIYYGDTISDTLLEVSVEVSTLVDFDFEVMNENSVAIVKFDYVVETSPDGTVWTSVASGSFVDYEYPLQPMLETVTVDADFNAPPTEGTYEVRITISGIEAEW